MCISAKCSDQCYIDYNGAKQNSYVPENIGLGGGDYIEFDFCLNCGQIQGDFPLEEVQI
jgi:hypothetical protein